MDTRGRAEVLVNQVTCPSHGGMGSLSGVHFRQQQTSGKGDLLPGSTLIKLFLKLWLCL